MVDQTKNLEVKGFAMQNQILGNIKQFENQLEEYKVAL